MKKKGFNKKSKMLPIIIFLLLLLGGMAETWPERFSEEVFEMVVWEFRA